MKTLSAKEWIALVIAVVIVLYFFVFAGKEVAPLENLNPLSSATTTSATSTASTTPMTNLKTYTLPGIVVTDFVEGTGAEATTNKTAIVHYTGYFENGEVFDSSIPRGQPFDFIIDQSSVIQGWHDGVKGMKVGGKRRLVISPEKAYGSQDVVNPQTGKVVIPANSTLIFDIELIGVK